MTSTNERVLELDSSRDAKPIALVGALDTKGAEYAFLREEVESTGQQVLLIDIGVLGEPTLAADIPRESVAAKHGTSIEELQRAGERGPGMRAMAAGAADHLRELVEEGAVAGVLAVGGSNAAYIMARISEVLPVGFPKVLVSTMASGDTRPYVGSTDLTMMNPIVDINGLNRITRPILRNAARGVVGMAAPTEGQAVQDAPIVAISMFGVTTPCASHLTKQLQGSAEPLSFHANGAGGRALEALVRSGQIQAVADMTTTELADELFGGVCSAGPDRLTAAGTAGIPQVVSLGALDMVNFGPRSTVPAHLEGRLFYEHNPEVTLMRTNPEECAQLGASLAERLNQARGYRAVVIPTRGVSMISVAGAPFHDPAADEALIESLRAGLNSEVVVVVLDTDINAPVVAETISTLILDHIEKGEHV
ncbi:Tm-1-like ATP-binding domain-containing protein [Pseudactinotalea sp. Z1739]|uniref:Tm-1-like ATP-binding domain-containing protein n=1 Tax=Pseudactinotalea sp. Z1739 TaxID=3413028 RepID=UPI003C7A6BAA